MQSASAAHVKLYRQGNGRECVCIDALVCAVRVCLFLSIMHARILSVPRRLHTRPPLNFPNFGTRKNANKIKPWLMSIMRSTTNSAAVVIFFLLAIIYLIVVSHASRMLWIIYGNRCVFFWFFIIIFHFIFADFWIESRRKARICSCQCAFAFNRLWFIFNWTIIANGQYCRPLILCKSPSIYFKPVRFFASSIWLHIHSMWSGNFNFRFQLCIYITLEKFSTVFVRERGRVGEPESACIQVWLLATTKRKWN